MSTGRTSGATSVEFHKSITTPSSTSKTVSTGLVVNNTSSSDLEEVARMDRTADVYVVSNTGLAAHDITELGN